MINKIIELLEEVATAYTYVQGFSYASPYEMNGAPSMQFPHILVADTPDWSNKGEYRGNGLGNKTTWDLRIFLFDTYNQAERTTVGRATKQQELKTAMDRYLAEFKHRALNELGYNVELSNGFVAKRQMNGKLEQCSANLRVTGNNTCDLGVFEYAG